MQKRAKALHPIDRRGDTLSVTCLKAINDSQYFGSISPCTRRIHHRQPNLLARVNDEDAANGESDALLIDIRGVLRVDHIVSPSNLAIRVRNDRKL